jgi:glucose/arabinose dehydrogenase
MKIRPVLAILSLTGILIGDALAQRQSIVTPQESSHLIATDLVWPANLKGPRDTVARKLWLPPGFSAQVFASGFPNPSETGWLRMMATDSQGVAHVADIASGQILAMPDRDHDGVADTIIAARKGVGGSNSIAFYKGFMYVAETDSVYKFSDDDHDGYYETQHPCVSDLHSGGVFDHWTRTIVIDPMREKLLVSVGTNCNACRSADEYRAVILEYNLDGTGRRIFATGLRNALGLAIEPKTNTLWATNADRNKMGDALPEEIITRVKDGGFYGWPYAYGDHEWVDFTIDSEYASMLPLTKADTERVASMEIGDLFVPAHATPSSVHFYQGQQFPEAYRTGYAVIRGSGESTKPVGYKVMRFWQDATQQWHIEDFLAGFLTDSSEYKFWGRPHGMTEGKDGALYFSSEGSPRRIIRVSYDPSKDVKRASGTRPDIRIIQGVNGQAWLETTTFDEQPASLQLESYDMAGHLLRRGMVIPTQTDHGIRVPLSELPSGPQVIVLRSQTERISSVVNIPK